MEESFAEVFAAKEARDARERLQVLAARALRADDGDEDVHLRVVDRFELEPFGDREDGGDLFIELAERAVRDGDAFADARRLQRFALFEHTFDLLERYRRPVREQLGEDAQRLGFIERSSAVVVPHGRTFGREKIGQEHRTGSIARCSTSFSQSSPDSSLIKRCEARYFPFWEAFA